ncbi:hypothetical protein HN512_00700 [Candidatus Peregrinibacteria bacterium]|jgi:hypothetical protein|nr:hypothetical protein [Candidatus Peregrinibacteria bacterium]MBT3598339.1 hypothetical protein [Candidatus Peregrinibacteria bacterium]MBT4367333.1 hypothetical protein [Candidatus Peregrinibacteria bacterium]MBT4585713.1 hypothetical protein [Candidatus Peregrinibacteria bacterium]MBT6730533.1 hypothetical protein [Candidatus Peregrinibacteria bacterium]
MSKNSNFILSWVKPIYLYLVSIITLIIIMVGSVTIINLIIREYVFDVQGSWYQNPESACEYIIMGEPIDKREYIIRGTIPADVSTNNIADMTPEERQKSFDHCVAKQEIQIEQQNRYNFADTMSRGIAMILVSVPLFIFHWRQLKKDS